MRLSAEHLCDAAADRRQRRLWRRIPRRPTSVFCARDPATALQSFFATIDRITADNPVAIPRLQELAGKARLGQITAAEGQELQSLKLQAVRQGRAVAAVIGFFLKLRPYPMLEEIRKKAKLFQPAFGPVLVVEGDAVRSLLERDQDFTVEPYGVEMMKVMTPSHNGGFTTFILSTDDNAVVRARQAAALGGLQPGGCGADHRHHSQGLHAPGGCGALGRPRRAVRRRWTSCRAVARYVPVTLGHKYLGVPVATQPVRSS